MTTNPCSAIILTAGAPRHTDQKSMAFADVGGRKALDWLMDLFRERFEEVILVTAEPLACLAWDSMIVRDSSRHPDALTGLHAGLFAASCPHALVATCESPLLQPQIVQLFLDTTAHRWDAVIGKTETGVAPFPGVYAKRCLKLIDDHGDDPDFDINRLVKQAHHTIVSVETMRALDPELVSFINIQSTKMLADAEAWLHRHITTG